MLFLVLKVLSQLFYMPSMIYFLKFTVKVFTINIVFTVSFFFNFLDSVQDLERSTYVTDILKSELTEFGK